MGSMSIWHWVIVAVIILVLFGKGRISEMMGDLGKGIKSFKKGMSDEEATAAAKASPVLDQQPLQAAPQAPPTSGPTSAEAGRR